MIEKGILAILSFIVVPISLGFLFTRFINKEKNSILFAFVIGYLVEFAICELISVPMIFLKCKFTTLLYTYSIIVGVLAIISIIINFKNIKEIITINIDEIKKTPKILCLLCIFLIGIQIYVFAGFMHVDEDDAFYVGTSVTTVQTNSLFKYDPATGALDGENAKIRFILGPFSLFISIISGILNTHPTIVSHLIYPIAIIPVIYFLYYLIAKKLFKEDRKSIFMFLILINIINMWGAYSGKSNFSYLLFRIWQGKAMLCNLIIPVIWLLGLNAYENEYKFIDCLLLFIAILAGNLTTTMGIGIPPIELMLLIFSFEISEFDFKQKISSFNFKKMFINLLKGLCCCIPSIINGLIYILY